MKLGGWMMMLVAMMIFLSLIGIPTGLTEVLSKVGINLDIENETINADIGNSSWWTVIMVALTAISAAAVIAGLFAKGYDTSLVIVVPIIWIGGLFIGTFWTVILYAYNNSGGQFWITGMVGLIFGTIAIGFSMACVDYFAGR